ncbi:MAG TPA: ATP-binding cassette domain-containing protein, partial [Ilumatobacteraceae bacterium]|nr:ATP-binding cassette domain-containing protein [Ilumatobacteraceae bacterium]
MSLLDVQAISVRFGGLMAVDNVSLQAEPGRITGLIGPNGAGKTTTFNVITGLQHPTMGRVSIDGKEVNRLAPHKRARLGMARTFQRLELFGVLTARENVMAAASMSARWRKGKEAPGEIADRLLE